jgi:hypothetical protein
MTLEEWDFKNEDLNFIQTNEYYSFQKRTPAGDEKEPP